MKPLPTAPTPSLPRRSAESRQRFGGHLQLPVQPDGRTLPRAALEENRQPAAHQPCHERHTRRSALDQLRSTGHPGER